MIEAVERIDAGQADPQPQDHARATHQGLVDDAVAAVDLDWPGERYLEDLIASIADYVKPELLLSIGTAGGARRGACSSIGQPRGDPPDRRVDVLFTPRNIARCRGPRG